MCVTQEERKVIAYVYLRACIWHKWKIVSLKKITNVNKLMFSSVHTQYCVWSLKKLFLVYVWNSPQRTIDVLLLLGFWNSVCFRQPVFCSSSMRAARHNDGMNNCQAQTYHTTRNAHNYQNYDDVDVSKPDMPWRNF